MGSQTFRALVGGLAGLLAWAIMEPTAPASEFDPHWAAWSLQFVVIVGALIGLAVGGLEGNRQGSRYHTIRGIVLGAVAGSIGISLGYGLGGRIVTALFGERVFGLGEPFLQQVLARILVLLPTGLGLGLGIGASTLTGKRVLAGAIGGALGGAVAGATFDIVGGIVGLAVLAAKGLQQGEVGGVSRALTGLLLGMAVALFIGMVERAMRSAWLRLTLGRNEGKEWALYGPRTMIGRSETAQVPLFGDPFVAPIHAYIIRQGNDYFLQDAGSGSGTFLNAQPSVGGLLGHGSQLQFGNTVLQFLLRSGRAPAPLVDARPQQPAVAPQLVQLTAPVTLALVALDGPLVGHRFEVGSAIEVGRDATGIGLGFDSSASRRHASVTPVPSGLAVNDLGSTNGTFVNGQRVTSATIHTGDLVKIGITTFKVV